MADFASTSLSLEPPVPDNTYLPKFTNLGVNAPPGTPLAQIVTGTNPGEVAPAKADSGDSTYVTGLATGPCIDGETCRAKYSGPLTLTVAQWAAVVEDVGGALEDGAPYYLSATTAGKITKNVPGSGFAAPLGIALSPTTLMIQISFPSVIVP